MPRRSGSGGHYNQASMMAQFVARVQLAIHRVRLGLLMMSCAYAIGLSVGIVSVHLGHQWSLSFRDRIVSKAHASSPILRYLNEGHPIAAAALDFGGNLLGATLTAGAGWYAPAPFPVALYRGWIGGIVSVDGNHQSRFRTMAGGFYYGLVLALQLAGYILIGGAGVNLGLARTRARPEYQGPRLLGVPVEAIRDAACMYVLVMPIFAIASTIEFLWDI
jgi:hypothetical protein